MLSFLLSGEHGDIMFLLLGSYFSILLCRELQEKLLADRDQ